VHACVEEVFDVCVCVTECGWIDIYIYLRCRSSFACQILANGDGAFGVVVMSMGERERERQERKKGREEESKAGRRRRERVWEGKYRDREERRRGCYLPRWISVDV
jgi:hypothetical protein